MAVKSTIKDIEALIDNESAPIEILPNGDIRRRKGEPTPKPITINKPLGGEYG